MNKKRTTSEGKKVATYFVIDAIHKIALSDIISKINNLDVYKR